MLPVQSAHFLSTAGLADLHNLGLRADDALYLSMASDHGATVCVLMRSWWPRVPKSALKRCFFELVSVRERDRRKLAAETPRCLGLCKIISHHNAPMVP
jgi:hypothetical protein